MRDSVLLCKDVGLFWPYYCCYFPADGETVELLWQLRAQRRQSSPELPETVTRLTAPDGSLLYLVGTAHFSDSSKKDVATVSQQQFKTGCVQCPFPLTTF